jgi:hypothetical protein
VLHISRLWKLALGAGRPDRSSTSGRSSGGTGGKGSDRWYADREDRLSASGKNRKEWMMYRVSAGSDKKVAGGMGKGEEPRGGTQLSGRRDAAISGG